MGDDWLDEFELGTAPDEIVVRVRCFIVGITVEEIFQEPYTLLEGDEFSCV